MTTRAELQPQIVTVQSALGTYKRAIDSVSSADLRQQYMGPYATNAKAIDSWAGQQADEVVAGTRTLDRWRSYGDELKANLELYTGQIGFVEQHSAAIDEAGNASQAVLAPLDNQVAKLQQQLDEITAKRAAWMKDRDALAPYRSSLSPALQDGYWGTPAQNADAAFARYKWLVEGLESGLRKLHGGQDIDFSTLAQSGGLSGGLGNPFIGVAGALAVIAIAAAIGAGLVTFFNYLSELAHVEGERLYVELAKTNPAAAVALQKGRNDAEGLRNPPSTFSAGAAITVVVVAGAAVGIAWWLLTRKPARVSNPRRRRRKKAARKEAHA